MKIIKNHFAKMTLLKRGTERRDGGMIRTVSTKERLLANLVIPFKNRNLYYLDLYKNSFDGVSSEYVIREGFIIHPASPFAIMWIFLSTVCVIFVLFVGPLEIGFDWFPERGSFIFIFERFVEAFFLLDIIVSFRLAYYDADSREMIQRPKKSAGFTFAPGLLLTSSVVFP